MDINGFLLIFVDHVDHVDILVHGPDRKARMDVPMDSRQLMDLAYVLMSKARKLEGIEDAA